MSLQYFSILQKKSVLVLKSTDNNVQNGVF